MTSKLEEMERLEKAATPGPWLDDTYNRALAARDHQYHHGPVQIFSIPDHPDEDSQYAPDEIAERSWWYKESAANMDLAISLRNAAPALLAVARAVQHLTVPHPEWCEPETNGCKCGLADLRAAMDALEGGAQ